MYFKSMTDQESQGRIGSGFFCMWKCNMSVPTPLKKPHFTPVDSLGEARKKTSQMPHLQRSRGQGGGTCACVHENKVAGVLLESRPPLGT